MTNPTSQAERLAVLHNDRLRSREASTLLDHVSNDSGGRFVAINKPTVIGTTPAAQYPAGAAWCADAVGVEPPLDATFCGNTFGEAMGEPHEQPPAEPDADWHHELPAPDAPTDAHSPSVVLEHGAGKPSPLLLPTSVRDRIARRRLP